jgi:hypothetical protein
VWALVMVLSPDLEQQVLLEFSLVPLLELQVV